MSHGGLKIGVAGPSSRRAALALVLRSLPADQRGPLVESLGRLRGEPLGAFDALVAVTEGDRVVASAWAQPQPGRTASLWLPEAEGVRLDRVSSPLIELAMKRADAAGVQLTQALVESSSDPSVPDLLACGFKRLTELHYMEWRGSQKPFVPPHDAAPISLAPIDSVGRSRLEEIVGLTYESTLDCPELDGMRGIGDVIDGYQQTGDYDPALWFLLNRQGEDAGVLLLNEHRASRQIELTYMGVVPAHRGAGIGLQAVAAAQRVAKNQQAERLVLAVDDRNGPARAVYRAAGFRPWASRTVFIRPAE